jgi:hypothetical protein
MTFSKSQQHQQINPVTDEVLADQGLAYLRYQNALMFVVPDIGVFNALMILSLQSLIDKKSTMDVWLPNVNGRPVRVTSEQSVEVKDMALRTYYAACRAYEDAEAEVQAGLRKTFETMSQEEV